MIVEFESYVAGIPCVIRVLELPTEDDGAEYEVLDRHLYRAHWLEDKMTDTDDIRIAHEVDREIECMKTGARIADYEYGE